MCDKNQCNQFQNKLSFIIPSIVINGYILQMVELQLIKAADEKHFLVKR